MPNDAATTTGAATGQGTPVGTVVTQSLTPSAISSANAAIAINVSGPAAGGFIADADYAGGATSVTQHAIDVSAPGAAPAVIYQSQRFGAMTYTVPGFSPGASLTIRLHFAEIYFGLYGRAGTGARRFNVSINGTPALNNFDILAAAGAADKAVVRTFTTTASASGAVVVSLTPGDANLPALNGLEVVPNASLGSEQAGQSDAFVNLIGINTHLSEYGTLYGNDFAAVKNLLATAGIRHLRDGTPANNADLCQKEATLSAAGIRMSILATGNATELAEGMRCLGATAEGIEGENEADLNDGANWVAILRANTNALATTYPASPLIAPSVTTVAAETDLGSLANIVAFGNAHAYFAGRNPGTTGWGGTDQYGTYGALSYNLNLARIVGGSRPIAITETGYSDAVDQYAVPAATKARYTVRTLLEAWNAGVARVYLYELIDEGSPSFSHYGILDASGTPKPAYIAIEALIHHLTDPGAAFAPSALQYGVTASPGVHHTLLQRRNGTYELLLWNEVPEWDPNARTTIPTTAQPVTLTFGKAPTSTKVTTFADNGVASTTSIAAQRVLTLDAGAWPTIVDLSF